LIIKYVEQNIESILQPTGLRFKKIKKNSYVILPSTINKATTAIENKTQELIKTAETSTEAVVESQVAGTVVDDKGIALAGVSILIKGTSKGTLTDEKGAYKIEVESPNAILVFSFIGFKNKKLLYSKSH